MKKTAVLAVAILFCFVSASSAAENESWIQKLKSRFAKKEVVVPVKTAPVKETKKIEAPKKERKSMTKGELAADIIKNLDREDSILGLVPGLEKKSGPGGKEYYAYQGTMLQDLDKETLDKIFGRVRNEALRLRTDKLNRQLETVRRASVTGAVVSQAPRSPVPQAINNPPRIPRTIQPPPKPPAPPAPPRR